MYPHHLKGKRRKKINMKYVHDTIYKDRRPKLRAKMAN